MAEDTVAIPVGVKPEHKAWIDSATYESMLRTWRFAPSGSSPLLEGATGKYFSEIMFAKKARLTPDEQVAISKRLGWGN